MINRETNTLELKYYNNLERLSSRQTNQQHNTNICFQGRNFMEFYIDGKCLINEIGRKFWQKDNAESFFDSKNSFLGAFDEVTDIICLSLLLKLASTAQLRKFINTHASCEMSEEKISRIFKTIKENEDKITLLYGCPCGDTHCGGIGPKIKKEANYYYWIFGEDKNMLSYKFESKEYEQALTNF